MNKNTHRLVFNAVRGMLVAVQENAVGRGKGRQGCAERQGQGTTFHPVLWLTVIAASMMGLPVILAQTAQAQTLPIQVDKNAPGARPVMGVAANGVPIVNIAAPNRNGGTSVNNFIQYNVGPSGVVLNNSGQNSQTQIAGWVQGNLQLGNNSAGVIVNQVTAPNPSQLMGMQEVAGNRATVILANPAGISCSGCGVINADRFTLSTGRALYGPDGSLSGFDVRDGHIAIDGQGLSSPQAQVDLLARSISINAELWAKHINAIAGANQVDYQNLSATAQAGNGAAPQFALDASALGSMYANGAIRLIGTEKGVGFNLGGIADARGGDITVDNNGDVRVLASGRLQSQGNATIAGANLDNAGTITTRGGITAMTPGQLTNTGTVAAGSDLLAQADRIANSGTLGAGADANANVTGAGTANIAAGTAIQSSGAIVAGSDANLSAPTLDLTNGSVVSHNTANLSASGDIINRNARVEGTALRVVADGNVDNQGGALVAGVNGGTVQATNLLNQGGAVTSGGALDVAASQAVDNTSGTIAGTGATTLAAASTVNRGGTLGAVQDKLLVSGALDNTGGKAMAAGDLKVAGAAILNDRGQISGQNVSLDTQGLGLSNAQGTIQGASSTHIAAGSLQNQDGTVTSGGTLDVQSAGQIGNQRGTIAANGSATIAASQTDNRGGTIGSVNDKLLVTDALDNTGGRALAGTDMTLSGGTIVNDHGQLAAGGNLKADTNGQALINSAGVISGGSVQTDTGAFHNQGGVLASQGTLQSDTHGQDFDNSAGGQVIAGGPLALNTAALNNQGGTISGQQAVTVNGTALDNTSGKMLAGGPLAVTGDSLANGGGQVASNADATLRIANTLENSAGFVHASGTLDAQAGTILNRNTLGGTDANPLGLEGGTVKLAATSIDNTHGAMRADKALDATASSLDNTQGEVTSGGTAQLNVTATTNTQGLLAANQKLGLTGTSLTGDGKVQSQGDIDLKLASDFRNTGDMLAGGNLSLDTSGDVDNLGNMQAGKALDLHGRNVSNAGELYGAVANTIRADQSVTNRGLIDGGAVRIEAGTTVTNVDRIFGDSVAIGAGQQIVNDVNPVTGNGGVIASRSGDVDLGAPEIINREHSLIYSSQDLNVGGALDANGKATGQATSLLNASATIDVVRDANFNVAAVTNRNDHFSTERIDTGTVHSQGYRLNGSDQEFKPEDVILYQVDNGTWAPGTDPAFLGDDDKKVLVLPSAQYPFAQFGPPFDWSRNVTGGGGKPVGAAYVPPSYDFYNDTMNPEVFVYQPGDAIWSKLGVQAPTAAPPLPVSCGDTPTSACQAKYDADTATYNAWRDANKPLYDQLNSQINAFNGDFNSRQVKEFFIVNKDTNIQDEKVLTTDPAKILVGRHATFPGDVTNDKSQILVGGDLNIDANHLHNLDYDATRIETVSGTQDWTFIKSHAFKGDDRRYTTSALDTIVTPVPLKLASALADRNLGTVGHDGSAPGQGAGVGPIAGAPLSSQPVLKELTLPATDALASNGPGAHLGGAVIRQVTPALAVPNNALFRTHPEPGARYLIETDPRFTDQRQWLSSDFMLTQLGQDPTNVLKRLGDGFYEARLVADAVMLGTGQRFVGDYTDNEQQYIGLMKAGVSFAQKFHLNVGSELTADQMAALTTDLVWLVEKTVTLPDGSTQRVLVPQVYLMSRVGDLKGDGALISANNTSIHTKGDVVNTGTISSRNVTLIDAQNIHNNGGTLNGGTLVLNAQEDINSLAGKISGNAVLAYAGRDINLASTTANGTGKAGSSNTVLAGVSSVNADTATLVAGRDLNAKAASLQTTGDLAMGAGRDVNLGTVTVAQTEHYEHDAKNKSDLSRSTEIGSQVSAGGNTTIVAGRDVNATAAYVNAEGALAVGAGRDINVQAGQASASVRDEHFTQSNGFLSSSSTHSIDANAHTEALGSTLSGNTVDMKAGHDMTIAGSTVAGTSDVNLAAGNNLTVTTAETTSSGYSFKEEKKSGFGATGSGLSYGNRNQKDTTNDRGTQQVGSLVGSTDGSVHMQAGSTLTVKGSDLIAKQDVTGVAADVNIEAAQNRQHHDETHEVKQRGFTLGVSGGAIGAAINAGNKISSASKSEDGRASALWGMAAARDVADAAQGMGNPLQGAAVTLSWGTSQSKQTLTQDSTSHNGSRVQAGGTAAFVATGVDANGNQTAGNLNIVGSDIDAKKVALGAKHDVNIVSATDTDESHSTNKSSSASVGVSYGAQGFGVSASASQAKGNSDNTSASQNNSHVNGSESVTIVSANDTNILGGTVSGGKVSADVGGNLNLASRQDTGESHAQQQSMGGGFSISQGGGSASFSASKGKADGSYANVTEQSGIYAGEGGFDLNVKGNTDLKGAVIASEASKDKNSLTTGTLTWSDIANHSDYSATSMGISGGGTMGSPNSQNNSGPTSGKNTGGISPMIPQHKSGSQDGVAQAAVAAGTITIKDEANQKQDLATLKRDTTGTNSQVGNNPDLDKLLNKQADMMAAAQAAGEAVAKTVGDIAKAKLDDANKRYAVAAEANKQNPSAENQAAMEAAQADIDGWKDGGSYRAALHTAGGALIAGLGGGNALAGAAGAGAASLAGGKLGELSNAVAGGADTGNAALNETLGNIAANIVADGIGAAVGGGSGAATAANVDRFNRQLHPSEEQKLKELQKGKTAEEQYRLAAAECALVHCADGVPDSSANKALLQKMQNDGQNYTAEQAQLQKAGAFDGYGTADRINDLADRYQVSNRAVGAVQGVTGAAAGAVALGAGCASVVACAAGAVVAGTSLDYSKAGFTQLVNGDPSLTYGEQALQSLGLSPRTAALAYAAASLGGAATGAALENQVGKQAAAFNDAARLSYTSIEKFGAQGMDPTAAVMSTSQAQTLVKAYTGAGVPLQDAQKYAAGLIETGTSLPTTLAVNADTELIKVVPKGAFGGDVVTPYSPYFMTRTEYDALSKLPSDQIAAKLGLPAEQAVRGSQLGFDVYSMKPLPGTDPQAFTSKVAPVQQGAYSAPGGAQQVLIPNRSQWSDPNKNKIGEIKGNR